MPRAVCFLAVAEQFPEPADVVRVVNSAVAAVTPSNA